MHARIYHIAIASESMTTKTVRILI